METAKDAPQTAMPLTDQDWTDLAVIADHYLTATGWVEHSNRELAERIDNRRRRALAQRIIESI
jgi:hypothetical protein